MKHIFVFIDKLVIFLKHVPPSLDTAEDKVKAKKAIVLIEEYTHTLRKLIESHKNKEYLDRLHQTHIHEIEDWVDQVTSLFKKLDSLLVLLDQDAKKLANVLENEPEKWQETVSYMSFGMFLTGLHDEEEDMIRLRNIAVFEIHELEKIISHEKHVEGLHKWGKFSELSEDEQIIAEERFFVELFS
ncbi:hypothetical protein HOC80_04575 [archaeon]|jgi:hypothetical protein|nr:hypothetical protein [archaeon]MBT4417349.1 hypothetical protein [archaeon]